MRHFLFTIALLATALTSGCSSDKEEAGGGSEEFGYAEIAATASADVEAQTRATVQLPASAIPSSEKFSLHVTGTYNDDMGNPQSYDKSWASVGGYDSPKMRRGDYKAVITSGNIESEGANAACFAGEQNFSILARRTESVTVKAGLVNAAFKVAFDTWFNNYYTDARIKIRTESNNAFIFTTATTTIIFAKPGTKLYMSGTAKKSQTGTEVEFPEAEIGTTTARTLHTITLKASEAGGSKLIIDLNDNFTEIEEKIIELNPEA